LACLAAAFFVVFFSWRAFTNLALAAAILEVEAVSAVSGLALFAFFFLAMVFFATVFFP